MQFHAGFGQPLLQVSDGHFAVVVEVGPGCDDLDRPKSKRPDLDEMVPIQSRPLVEVRGDPKRALCSHEANHSCYQHGTL